jgi:hypothetical protein
MRCALAIVAVLAFVLSASSAAALSCLNSKPCGTKCIAYNKVCHLPPACPPGTFHCGKGCIPDRDLCGVH